MFQQLHFEGYKLPIKKYSGALQKNLLRCVSDVLFLVGVCENEAVQRRAAGVLSDICPLTASQHHSSGHQGLLSCS